MREDIANPGASGKKEALAKKSLDIFKNGSIVSGVISGGGAPVESSNVSNRQIFNSSVQENLAKGGRMTG